MTSMIKKITGCLFLLLLALLCTGSREAKADVITFDDVNLSPGGFQPISNDRYLSQGVRIFTDRFSAIQPVVISTTDANTPHNILWGGPLNPSQGDRNGLIFHFTYPGTLTPSATNFISFYVIDNGDQQLDITYEIIVTVGYGEPEYFFQKGSGLFTFSSPLNDIWGFSIHFLNSSATSGIDTLTFNSPTNAVPEPATILLLGSGLAGVAARIRRRHTAKINE